MPADDDPRESGHETETTPDGPCGCPLKNDWADDADPCREPHPEEDGPTCSRVAGHDGPHTACSVQVHPRFVWGAEDSE